MIQYQVQDNQGNKYGCYVLRIQAEDAVGGYRACPISCKTTFEIVEVEVPSHRDTEMMRCSLN